MNDLGLDKEEDEGELDYDMEGEAFYNDTIFEGSHSNNLNVKKVMIGPNAKREITGFETMFAECDALVNRKVNIQQL